jgi:hypothetical protein
MKWMKVLYCKAILVIILGAGIGNVLYADINALPAVATNGNDEVTITWGSLGLGSMPSILAKRYGSNGEPIDNVEFSVSSPFGAPSIFNYDPDVATDNANNSIIAWCSFEFSSPAKEIQVVYTTLKPPSVSSQADKMPVVTVVSPQQDQGESNLFTIIPFLPVIAVDSEDNIAIAWSYYDFESGESGIYLVVVDSSGTAIDPVKVVSNLPDTTTTSGQVSASTSITSTFYYAPAVAFDGEGNIVITYTAAGMLPFLEAPEPSEIPMIAVFYSKYTTSGSVVEGYDKLTISVGFNSTAAADSSGNVIIAWNTFDIFTFTTRIMAAIYYAAEESASGIPFEVGVQSDYAPSDYVDTGNHFSIKGMDVTADSEGNFFIAWGGSNLGSEQIYLKAIYSDGNYLSSEIQVSQGFDANYDPSIATDSQGNITITWNKLSDYSIYARRFDNNLQALGDEFKVNVIY